MDGGFEREHPLRELLSDESLDASHILSVFEELLAAVQGAEPARWKSKRRAFRRLKLEQQVLEMRAELVVAAMLVRAGMPYVFGENKVPNPDLVLHSGLGIEVTARAPAGVQHLYAQIDEMLQYFPACAVTLRFSQYPTRLDASVRNAVVEQARVIASRVEITRVGGVVQERALFDPRTGLDLVVQAVVHPVPRLVGGLRVTWETDAGSLGPALDAVKTEVLSVLESAEKCRQAQSMPTVLVVDIARLGAGWMRPPVVWAHELAGAIPASCPFVGLAVFVPSLDSVESEIALAVSPSVSTEVRKQIDAAAIGLGLEASP